MRKKVTVDTTVDHPVDRVFAYLADPVRWHEFVPAVALRRPIGSGPVEVGSRWEAIDRIGPFKVQFIDELLEIESDRRVAWGSSAPWNARTEYVLEPADGGTRVRATYEGDIGGWLRIFGWLPAAIVGRFLAQDFKRLGRLLEAAPQPERG